MGQLNSKVLLVSSPNIDGSYRFTVCGLPFRATLYIWPKYENLWPPNNMNLSAKINDYSTRSRTIADNTRGVCATVLQFLGQNNECSLDARSRSLKWSIEHINTWQ